MGGGWEKREGKLESRRQKLESESRGKGKRRDKAQTRGHDVSCPYARGRAEKAKADASAAVGMTAIEKEMTGGGRSVGRFEGWKIEKQSRSLAAVGMTAIEKEMKGGGRNV